MDLNDFYSTFFSADPKNISTLDMQATFRAVFYFNPSRQYDTTSGGLWSKIEDAAKEITQNAVSNITGGLIGQDSESVKRLKPRSDTKQTIMNYITEGTMIGDGDGTVDMTMFIQQMTLPNIQMSGIEDIQTLFGQFSTSGYIIEPDSHEFTMNIVNTKLPIHETVFYPWMQEVTSPYWCYKDQPYTTATVVIDLSEHADIKYTFFGCRPYRMITIDPTMQTPSQFTRDVIFKFDFMSVQSSLKSKESVNDKIKSVGNSLLNGAGGIIGI